jgi:hypothetical protein
MGQAATKARAHRVLAGFGIRVINVLAVVGLLAVLTAHCTEAVAAGPGVSWSATVDGRDVGDYDSNHALQLSPQAEARIAVRVKNLGRTPLKVRFVLFEGRVLGLAFFSYTTRVDLQAAPGAIDERAFSIDLLNLDGQATGLIPARVVLLDPQGRAVGSRSLTVDVRGSLRSVYGTFALAVAAATLLLLASALWGLGTGRSHPNRWRRAMTFAGPGLGVGFVLTFTLSALRLLVASPTAWTLLILLGGITGFVAGYFSPTPEGSDLADRTTGRLGADEDDHPRLGDTINRLGRGLLRRRPPSSVDAFTPTDPP